MSSFSIGLLVFPDVEELDFVGPWEVFTASGALREQAGEAPDRAVLVAADSQPIRCSKGLRIIPDATFDPSRVRGRVRAARGDRGPRRPLGAPRQGRRLTRGGPLLGNVATGAVGRRRETPPELQLCPAVVGPEG